MLGFDFVEALDATWRMYNKSDELAQLMHRLFITDELLKRMRVKFIEIRTRMWEDEYLKCRNEITSGQPGRTPIYKKSTYLHKTSKPKITVRVDFFIYVNADLKHCHNIFYFRI